MQKQTTFSQERDDIKERLEHIQENRYSFSLLLDHVNDDINIGSIFRLADAVRLKKIYLYNKVEKSLKKAKIQRVSRSAIKYVDFEELNKIGQLEQLKKQYHLVGLEITNTSIPYHSFEIPEKPLLIIIGNEKFGISEELLSLIPETIHIPMHGINTSMNVAMASAIFCYYILQKIK